MNDMRVSVIVPAHNAEATVGRCVAALLDQTYVQPYEVLVVDDGSTDRTAEIARLAGAKVISTARRRPAGARNAGIRASRSEIICCTDADCTPHRDWLVQMTSAFDDPTLVACKGAYVTRQRQLIARFVQLEYEDKYDRLRQQGDIDFIDTYSAAYRRDVLVASGGFDERFDYLEDQELSFRLAAKGHRMVFCDKAIVEHLHSATLGTYLKKKSTIGYWKSQVVRLHPERLVKDSHTPQIMKLQIALALLGVLAIAAVLVALPGAGLLGVPARFWALAAFGVGLLFLLTTVPFVRKAWPKDRSVAFWSPVLLFGRALALGAGTIQGLLKPVNLWEASTQSGVGNDGTNYSR
ncbi:MAG TPA: glycosyltransferase [Promineifilum sp.]